MLVPWRVTIAPRLVNDQLHPGLPCAMRSFSTQVPPNILKSRVVFPTKMKDFQVQIGILLTFLNGFAIVFLVSNHTFLGMLALLLLSL